MITTATSINSVNYYKWDAKFTLQSRFKIIIAFISMLLVNQSIALEPEFGLPMENITVVEGRDAIFSCIVNNLGGYRLTWIAVDSKAILTIHTHVITRSNRVFVMYDDFNTWTLIIKRIKREDRGHYKCQLNTDPMIMQTAFLEVVVPPDIINEESSGDMIVPEGGSAKLVCKTRGFPKPKIVWRREDSHDILVPNDGISLPNEGETLSLSNVSRSDMGKYLCIASNGVPPGISKRIKLQVHFNPFIHVPNDLVDAPVGTDIKLVCNVEASPKSITYWLGKNGEMLSSDDRYTITESDTSMYAIQMVLQILKLDKADFGEYKCVSRNNIGYTQSTILLSELKISKQSKSNEQSRNDGPKNDLNSKSNLLILISFLIFVI